MLTQDQAQALAAFNDFRQTGEQVFALVGYAGTGKSYLTQIIVNDVLAGDTVIAAAPSHKAKQVLSEFLGPRVPVVTVSALSGERMKSREAEAEKEAFVRTVRGKITDHHGWVLVDEISMVRRDQYDWIAEETARVGGRLIIVGDPAQLAPVQGKPVRIGTKTFPYHAVLRQIVRSDDKLAQVGLAIREGVPWDPSDVRTVSDLTKDFLGQVKRVDDGKLRQVYLAYTNREVRAVQQAACVKLYGHGSHDVANGEWVRAENTNRVTNGSLLQVSGCRKITDKWNEDVWLANQGAVLAPYSRKDAVLKTALDTKKLYGREDRRTRQAWAHYYYLIQDTQLFSHPYAMTVHKSQGSTFEQVWADVDSLLHERPLAYVAATRASKQLTTRGEHL